VYLGQSEADLGGCHARPQAVHSGADLQASAKEASGQLPGSVKGYLGYVLAHAQDHILLPLMENAVEARTELNAAMTGNRRARLPPSFPLVEVPMGSP
jgi:hypothetical protein